MIDVHDLVGILGVIAVAGACIYAILRERPAPPDPPSPVTMFVLDGARPHHGRWVELHPGVRCDCDSDEWVDVATGCGRAATIHHCHKDTP